MIVKIICSSSVERAEEIGLLQHLKVNNLSGDWRLVGSQRALLCQACDHSSKYFARLPTAPHLLMIWWGKGWGNILRLFTPPLENWSSQIFPIVHCTPVSSYFLLLLVDADAISARSSSTLSHLILLIQSQFQSVHRWKETRLIAMCEQTQPLNWLITNYHPLVSLNWLAFEFYCTQLKKNQ